MAYADIYNAATDPAFQGRCMVAMWAAAQNIAAEDPQTKDHAQRFAWASSVLRDTARITPRQLAIQVLRNSTIAAKLPADSADGDLQFQLNSIIADLVRIG